MGLKLDDIIQAFGGELGFGRITRVHKKPIGESSLSYEADIYVAFQSAHGQEEDRLFTALHDAELRALYIGTGMTLEIQWVDKGALVVHAVNARNQTRLRVGTASVRESKIEGGGEVALALSETLLLPDEISHTHLQWFAQIVQRTMITLFVECATLGPELLKEFGAAHN